MFVLGVSITYLLDSESYVLLGVSYANEAGEIRTNFGNNDYGYKCIYTILSIVFLIGNVRS